MKKEFNSVGKIVDKVLGKPKVIEKEFNLSEKISSDEGWEIDFVYTKDIKEFIKEQKSLIKLLFEKKITKKEFWERNDKLAGEKLR